MADALVFNVGADTKGFQDGLDGILGKLAGLAAAFLSVQAVMQAFGEAIDMGGRLNDLSTRTGETAGNLALLERAFENAGVGAEKLGPAINKMQKSMADMASGGETSVAAFNQLGLAWDDLEDKSPSEQLQLIGQRLAAIEDPSLRSATAMAIFGRSGGELLPFLTNFSGEMATAADQLGSLPGLLDDTNSAFDSVGDNLGAIGNKLTELAYGFLSEVIPAIDVFTTKLAGVDAAALGADIADAIVGALVNPLQGLTFVGDILVLGVKTMGNELIAIGDWFGRVMFDTFATIGSQAIPMLGNNMLGAFQIAAGGLGEALLTVIGAALSNLQPIADWLGFGSQLESSIGAINQLQADANQLMVDGASKIAESSTMFLSAFEGAASQTPLIRQDFLGAEASAAKVAADFAGLQESAQEAIDTLSGTEFERAGGRTTTGTDTTLFDMLQALDEVNQTPNLVTGGGGGGGGKTQAQQEAQIKQLLALLAGVSPNQLTGSSASAEKALELMKKIEIAQAKGDKTDSLQRSLERNLDIAFGANLDAADMAAATQWAIDQMLAGNPLDMFFSDLEDMAQKNILERNRDDAGITKLLKDQDDKKNEQTSSAGAAGKGGAGGSPLNTIMADVAELKKCLVQKIEPKLPQQIMA